ncbi:MAG: hypothetical protein JXB47_08470 [Anaerolineae bacterium]|nr:hypothetical protein [Anaerolineae bacterium]
MPLSWLPGGDAPAPIRYAGNIAPDAALQNARVKITLSRLRVADYPGGGVHHVLAAFYAQNQVPGDVEDLHFNATYRVREREMAGVQGYPVFVGLNVGAEGLRFKCRTVNVTNAEDESLLGFLDSDVFKSGLQLLSTAQPALGPLSQMALGLARVVVGHRQNVSIQDIDLGLDFSAAPLGLKLAQGTYLAVQIPMSLGVVWDWRDWQFDPNRGAVVRADDPAQLIPYNYLAFSVSQYTQPDNTPG